MGKEVTSRDKEIEGIDTIIGSSQTSQFCSDTWEAGCSHLVPEASTRITKPCLG